MSRRIIVSIAVLSCASLFAFAPLRQQGAPKGGPAMTMAPTAWVIMLELSKWDPAKQPNEQPGFAEHHANVEKLAKEGTLLVGGPFLEGKENKPSGAMMIVKADSAEAAKKLVADDPIIKNDMMKIGSVRGFMVGAGVWAPPQAAGAPKH